MICTNEALRGLPMSDRSLLVRAARDLAQGMLTAAGSTPNMAPRLGVCIVERCARMIEASCKGCREAICQRCSIAAELRGAETVINAERDAEIAALGIEKTLDEIIDKIVEGLCGTHTPFGTVLVEEWYVRKIFTSPPAASESS
jgi:hypothetical protein